jgi:hypothetical protein
LVSAEYQAFAHQVRDADPVNVLLDKASSSRRCNRTACHGRLRSKADFAVRSRTVNRRVT